MMRPPSSRQRGVTLIELMFVVALSSIFLIGIGTTMSAQMTTSFNQLEFIEAQQNARASIAIIKSYVRGAGWGRPYQSTTRGIPFLGSCFKTGDDRRKQDGCNAVDDDTDGNPGMDRIRVLGIEPVEQGTPPTVLDPASTTNTMSSSTDISTVSPLGSSHVMANNEYGVLSGTCSVTGTEGMELVRASPGSCSGATETTCTYTIVERVESDPCAGNPYTDGFAFGKALLADFFIDRSNADHPALKLRLDPSKAVADAHTVAWDIDDLQIQYGVDSGDPLSGDLEPDGLIDSWCHDLNSNTCAPDLANVYEKQSRIVAVRVAIVSRSRNYEAKRDTTPTNISVFDHTFLGKNDGYRRWIYRATIALRNNQL